MNPAVAAIEPSLIRQINALKRPGDIDLGLGQPSEPIKDAWLDRAVERLKESGCPYTPNPGLREVREAVAARRLGEAEHFDRIVMTHGSQEGVYLCLKALIDPAEDEVLIPSPAYGAYHKLCQLEGIVSRDVSLSPSDLFEPQADVLAAAITQKTRMIILSSPNNPTGRVWKQEEAKKLVAALKARSGPPVWLLVDEVYREMVHVEDAAFFDDIYDYTLNVGGLSKSHSLTGLRIGWVAGPKEVVAPMVLVHQQVTTAASIYSQFVTAEVMADVQSFEACQSLWRKKAQEVQSFIQASAIDFAPLDGAFYAWMRLPDHRYGGGVEACRHLLKELSVVTVPGTAFGSAYENWIRLSYAGPVEMFAEGLTRIKGAFEL